MDLQAADADSLAQPRAPPGHQADGPFVRAEGPSASSRRPSALQVPARTGFRSARRARHRRCDADTETPPAPCLSRYHIVSAKSTISALSKVQTRHLSECRSGTLQGSPVPRTGDGARHALNRALRERRAAEQVEEQRPAARAEAHARQLGGVEDVDRELERLAALRDPDQAVDVLDPGRERVRVDDRRGGIVLTRDEPAARRDREVVGRVQLESLSSTRTRASASRRRAARGGRPRPGRSPPCSRRS